MSILFVLSMNRNVHSICPLHRQKWPFYLSSPHTEMFILFVLSTDRNVYSICPLHEQKCPFYLSSTQTEITILFVVVRNEDLSRTRGSLGSLHLQCMSQAERICCVITSMATYLSILSPCTTNEFYMNYITIICTSCLCEP